MERGFLARGLRGLLVSLQRTGMNLDSPTCIQVRPTKIADWVSITLDLDCVLCSHTDWNMWSLSCFCKKGWEGLGWVGIGTGGGTHLTFLVGHHRW